VFAQTDREIPEVQDVAPGAVDHEQGRTAVALLDLHQRLKVAGRLGDGRRAIGTGRRRRLTLEPRFGGKVYTQFFANDLGARLDAWRLKQQGQRKVDVVDLLDPREQPDRDQRMATEVEEVVTNAHAVDAEQRSPHGRKLTLDLVARGIFGRGSCHARGRAGLRLRNSLRPQLFQHGKQRRRRRRQARGRVTREYPLDELDTFLVGDALAQPAIE